MDSAVRPAQSTRLHRPLDVLRPEWPARWMFKRPRTMSDWDDTVQRDFSRGARYLVGVSGGRDSVALLHWLQAQKYRKLIVCHLEHGLRARAGRADARFVERMAARAGLPFELKSE